MMDLEIAEELPEPVKKFYKREPLALGITQILLGIETIMFGVVLSVDENGHDIDYVHEVTSYLAGALYIISGSLSVAAAKNPKASLLKCMLGMNVVSAVASGVATVILSLQLSSMKYRGIKKTGCSSSTLLKQEQLTCYDTFIRSRIIVLEITVVLLLFSTLELCISISIAAFGFNAIYVRTLNKTVVMIYDQVSPDNAVAPPPQQRPRILEHRTCLSSIPTGLTISFPPAPKDFFRYMNMWTTQVS